MSGSPPCVRHEDLGGCRGLCIQTGELWGQGARPAPWALGTRPRNKAAPALFGSGPGGLFIALWPWCRQVRRSQAEPQMR